MKLESDPWVPWLNGSKLERLSLREAWEKPLIEITNFAPELDASILMIAIGLHCGHETLPIHGQNDRLMQMRTKGNKREIGRINFDAPSVQGEKHNKNLHSGTLMMAMCLPCAFLRIYARAMFGGSAGSGFSPGEYANSAFYFRTRSTFGETVFANTPILETHRETYFNTQNAYWLGDFESVGPCHQCGQESELIHELAAGRKNTTPERCVSPHETVKKNGKRYVIDPGYGDWQITNGISPDNPDIVLPAAISDICEGEHVRTFSARWDNATIARLVSSGFPVQPYFDLAPAQALNSANIHFSELAPREFPRFRYMDIFNTVHKCKSLADVFDEVNPQPRNTQSPLHAHWKKYRTNFLEKFQ